MPFQKKLGDMFRWSGRMLSASKTAPKGHICVWNANIVTENKDKVWFGDLDLTDDAEALQWYADDLGLTIYVMYEMDARFLRPGQDINLSLAVASYSPKE